MSKLIACLAAVAVVATAGGAACAEDIALG